MNDRDKIDIGNMYRDDEATGISDEWDDDEREELQELSMSDDEEAVAKSRTSQKLKYSPEELMALKDEPRCTVKPGVLRPEYFDQDGFWDPNLWHSAVGSLDGAYRTSGKMAAHAGKTIQHISKRFSLEDSIPVLSPHRQSFGPGCHVEKTNSTTSSVHDKENIRGHERKRVDRSKRNSEGGCGERVEWLDPIESSKRPISRSSSNRSEPKLEKKRFTTAAAASSRNCASYVADVNNNKARPSSPGLRSSLSREQKRHIVDPKKSRSKSTHDDSLDDPPRASVAAVQECQIGNRMGHQSSNETEPEWMAAGVQADLEFDFGNLEALKKKFNNEADVSENKVPKKIPSEVPQSFDINSFFQGERKDPTEADSSIKQSRFTQLFAKKLVDENRNYMDLASDTLDENPLHSAVYDVNELEAPYMVEAGNGNRHDLKAFNDLLSKIKVTTDDSTHRIPSPGLDLFGSKEAQLETMRPFSPFSNPDGPRVAGVFNDLTNQNNQMDPFLQVSMPQKDTMNYMNSQFIPKSQENVQHAPLRQSRLAHLFERDQQQIPAYNHPQLNSDNLYQAMQQHQIAANNQSALRNNTNAFSSTAPKLPYSKQVPNDPYGSFDGRHKLPVRPSAPPNLAFNNAMVAAAAYQSSQSMGNRYLNGNAAGLPVTQSQLLSQMSSNQALLKQAAGKLNAVAASGASVGNNGMRQLPLPLVPPPQPCSVSGVSRSNPYLPYPLLPNSSSAGSVAAGRSTSGIHPTLLLRAQALNAARGRAALFNRINNCGGSMNGFNQNGASANSINAGGLSTQQLLMAKQNILAAAYQQQRAQAAAAYHNES
jgi:hypothetical protein